MAELDGFEGMIAALRAIGANVVAATPEGLSNAGHHLESQIKLELSRTSHPYGTPTPSAPGSPPSLVSGSLRRSIQADGPSQSGPGHWSMQIGSGMVYAAIQEYGGQANHSHLPARPYMAPGLTAAMPGMAAYMEQAWGDALE